jgi:AcrR family transcriptional regulator
VGESTDLRRTILGVANALFMENGYTATSIKKIANAAGCTTAALYYYFEGGKSHILHEVVRSYSLDVLHVFDDDASFDDLADYLRHLNRRVSQSMPELSGRLSWLVLEIPHLAEDVRGQLFRHFLGLNQAISTRLATFVPDESGARMLAWIIVCAYLGYGQLFLRMGFEGPTTPDLEEFGEALMEVIGQHG